MTKFEISSDQIILEIKYPFGQLFWDRVGQTLLDIEARETGWFSTPGKDGLGRSENPEKNIYINFNHQLFAIYAKNLRDSDYDDFFEEANKNWKIIKSNFGIDEINRVGLRFHLIKPTSSWDESEKLLMNSELNLTLPKELDNSEYELKVRHMIGVFEKEDYEYRVELKGIQRSEGINPVELFQGNVRKLSKNQKKYINLKMKQMRDYSINPMYAVMLDIDCIQYEPSKLDVKAFANKQKEVVESDFRPILESL